MDISMQNPIETTTNHDVYDGNGVALTSSSASPIFPHHKFLVSVEVCLKPSSTARNEDVRLAVESEEGPCEELSEDGQLSSFNEWILPAKEFDGMWESLIYEPGLKQRLLRYAASALLFTEKRVDPFLVSWNR
ncbi:unnamed protein product [Dovyalis caffra]|uniref:Pachytene checkpoint protein 2 homolog n=1 Tax=Dovyalis caffra TaxID=77055 RepID=A0AAV1SWQ1_9ROSI|nr:unnamed protein product [Dovyalis caffra]